MQIKDMDYDSETGCCFDCFWGWWFSDYEDWILESLKQHHM